MTPFTKEGARRGALKRVSCEVCGQSLRPCNLAPHMRRHDADLFWSLVERTDGCWLWKGPKQSYGYGFFAGGILAHRAAYEFTYGLVPDDLNLDHLCHNEDTECRGGKACPHRLCVRPDHLEAVAPVENARRGRGSRRFCKNGHERTPDNFYHQKSGRKECRLCKQQAQKTPEARARRAKAERERRRRLRTASNGSGSTSSI